VAMAVGALTVYRFGTQLLLSLALPEKVGQIVVVLVSIGAAMSVYVLATWLLRSPEIQSVMAALKRKLRGANSVDVPPKA